MLVIAALACGGCERPPPGPTAQDRAALANAVERLEAARAAQLPVATEVLALKLIERFPASAEAARLRQELPTLRAEAEAWLAARRRADLWRYGSAEHAEGFQLRAELDAAAVADAPPLRLVLRRHPKFGQSVYLLMDGGADFACAEQCTIEMAFDDAAPRGFAARRALDNVPPALFMRDHGAFHAALEEADTLRIAVPLASGARIDYRFEVGGYRPERMQGDGSGVPPGR